MRRREFITLVGGAMLPLAARAQQPGKLPTIGFLVSGTPASHGQWFAVLAQRLREFGWIEGRTIAIEYRFAQGREESFTEIFAEFVRHRVDIIVTSGAAILAAKQVASNIPIVFAAAIDPVSMGLVASLARPGGNITGLSLQGPDLAGKRLELLREVVPNLRRVAVLANTGTPGAVRGLDEARTSAHALGLEAAPLEIRRAEDIAPAIASVKGGADALYACADPHRRQPDSNHYSDARFANARHLRITRARRSRWSDVLRGKLSGLVPARCRACRQNSPRHQAR
jgi:putative ABC transport system substrate-binding protein